MSGITLWEYKKMGEEIIEDFINVTDKKAISLRYFNPVGPESQGLLGDLQPIPICV